MLWPPQRTPISRSRSRAMRTAATTSSTEAQRRSGFGRWSIIAFQTDRAESYPGLPGVSTRPPKCERRSVVSGNCAVVVMARRLPGIGPLDKVHSHGGVQDQFVASLGAGDRPGPRRRGRSAPPDRGVDPRADPLGAPAGGHRAPADPRLGDRAGGLARGRRRGLRAARGRGLPDQPQRRLHAGGARGDDGAGADRCAIATVGSVAPA